MGATPERSRIDQVVIKAEHPIIEFQSGACFIIQANEILDISPRLLDVPHGIVRLNGSVANHYGPRVKRLDLINCGEPVAQPLPV